MEDKNQTEKTVRSRFRLDLAARLFRPHLIFFRVARSTMTPVKSLAGPHRGRDSFDPQQSPVDIICAGMYRACSTWQYEVVAHLIEQYHGGQRLGYLRGEQYTALRQADVQNPDPAARRVWRVFKSHDGDRVFAKAARQGQARVVYAYRDVRDVVFSLMHKRGLRFEQLMRQGMIHQVLANDRFWMAQPDVVVQRYEELLVDPASGVLTLARFLGIALEQGEAVRIAESYSQEANRARAEALRDRLRQSGVDLESAANYQICDPATLLHWNHLRPGGGGSWITKAEPRHRVVLKRLCRRWLAARGYDVEPVPLPRSPVGLLDLVKIEADLTAARINVLVQNGSRRFPRLSRSIKRMLGIPSPANVGATAWSDPVSTPSIRHAPDLQTSPIAGGTAPIHESESPRVEQVLR
jgi:Sulfotransferase domain